MTDQGVGGNADSSAEDGEVLEPPYGWHLESLPELARFPTLGEATAAAWEVASILGMTERPRIVPALSAPVTGLSPIAAWARQERGRLVLDTFAQASRYPHHREQVLAESGLTDDPLAVWLLAGGRLRV